MAPPQGGTQDDDAKYMFDRIGKIVHDQVKTEAETYTSELKGDLSLAKFSDRSIVHTDDPCNLNYKYDTNVTSTVIDPCADRSDVRFSDVHGGQCTHNRIKDSKEDNSEGACAPYRRLHVCDQNLEQIRPEQITSTHNLLVDVCMAAQFEGKSITGRYRQYQEKYKDTGSTMCTMLARSFADIGDIVRGKDLYLGDRKEKVKLEKKLKQYFKNIYDKLDGKKGQKSAKEYYQDDKENFYQLREDWWDANRHTVWEAITCNAGGGNRYFRQTCGSGKTATQASHKCRCDGANVTIVPTYFDYVPQYLRWFEEWAEDFCRKRKHKLENAKKQCREKDKDGKKLYCDLNGYDCKTTISAKKKLFPDSDCHECSYSCIPFRTWIDNQKKEFEKQKEKYGKEIQKKEDKTTTITTRYGTINNMYVDVFYNKLHENYPTVNEFLELLSKETACESQPHDDGRVFSINFKNPEGIDIFSHTEYCQACPWCGMDCTNGDKCTKKQDNSCYHEIVQKEYPDTNTTTIPVLTPEEGKSNILEKYKNFCNSNDNNSDQIKNWECHYEENDKSNNCILGKWEKFQMGQEVMVYHPFFWKCVTEMLDDSIKWRAELDKCLKNNKKTCGKKKCKDNCGCFLKWIGKKKTEWDAIKKHFYKQKDLLEQINGGDPNTILEGVLKLDELFNNIKDTYGNVKEIDHIRKILEEDEKEQEADGGADNQKKTTIDKLLDYEERIATECKNCKPQEQEGDTSPARSLNPLSPAAPTAGRSPQPRADHQPPVPDTTEDDDEDDISDVEDGDLQDDAGGQESEPQPEAPQEPAAPSATTPGVTPACDIVDKLFTSSDNTALNEACQQKYEYGHEKFPNWKCIPSGDKTGTSEGSDANRRVARSAPSGKDTGSICVPPRRRKLYVGHLQKWEKGTTEASVSSQAGSESQVGEASQGGGETPQVSTPSTSSGSHRDPLLTAFVESAAVETFFLWHKYKADKAREKKERKEAGILSLEGEEEDPQNKLNGGDIPDGFLRQMFYTLGDYKDIFEGKNMEVVNLLKDGSPSDKEMQEREEKIRTAISTYFSNNGNNQQHSITPSQSRGNPSNSGKDPESWWKEHAESIWNGMIYALTYNTNSGGEDKKIEQIQDAETLLNKLKEKYGVYESVELENSGTEARTNDPINNPKLSDFVEIPPFFRWLHEWGSDFCDKRARMLKNVKKACRKKDDGDDTFCSGDGHDCTRDGIQHNNMFADPGCPGCAKECRKYRKWIDMKFAEFHKQNDKYKGEHGKIKANCSGDDKKFCQQIKEKNTTAGSFLAALKHCKSGEANKDDKDKGNQEDELNKLDFKNITQTFSPSTYCKTCPPNEVNCNRGKRGTNPCTPDNGNTWQSVFNGNNEKITENINLEMIDRRAPFIEKYLKKLENSLFKDSHLFKSVRTQEWKCKFNDQKMNVCKLDKFEKNIDLNEYTTFKVLLIYWLEDFIEGYYILKKRKIIDKCTENGEKACSEESKNDCVCVKEWVEKKKKEWEDIKNHFKKRKQEDIGNNMKSSVRQLLEDLQHRTELNKAIKPCKDLDQFENSIHCNVTANSGSGNPEKKDIVQCLIDKLQKEIKTCPGKPSGDTQPNCDEKSAHVEDDEEDLLLEEENPVDQQPGFCPKVDTPKPEEGGCKPDVKEEEEQKEEEKDKGDEESGSPPAGPAAGSSDETNTEQKPEKEVPQKPAPPPAPAPVQPPQAVEPFDPTILQTTIPFGIALALTSIAFFFMKVNDIYIYIYIYTYICGIYICGCICMYFIYIYVFVLKKIKNKKKNWNIEI